MGSGGLVCYFAAGDVGDGDGEVVVHFCARHEGEDDVELDGLSGAGGTSKELMRAVQVGYLTRRGRSMLHPTEMSRIVMMVTWGILLIFEYRFAIQQPIHSAYLASVRLPYCVLSPCWPD